MGIPLFLLLPFKTLAAIVPAATQAVAGWSTTSLYAAAAGGATTGGGAVYAETKHQLFSQFAFNIYIQIKTRMPFISADKALAAKAIDASLQENALALTHENATIALAAHAIVMSSYTIEQQNQEMQSLLHRFLTQNKELTEELKACVEAKQVLAQQLVDLITQKESLEEEWCQTKERLAQLKKALMKNEQLLQTLIGKLACFQKRDEENQQIIQQQQNALLIKEEVIQKQEKTLSMIQHECHRLGFFAQKPKKAEDENLTSLHISPKEK